MTRKLWMFALYTHTVEGTGLLTSTSIVYTVQLTLQEREKQAYLTAACEQEHTKCTPAHSQLGLQRGYIYVCVCRRGKGGIKDNMKV